MRERQKHLVAIAMMKLESESIRNERGKVETHNLLIQFNYIHSVQPNVKDLNKDTLARVMYLSWLEGRNRRNTTGNSASRWFESNHDHMLMKQKQSIPMLSDYAVSPKG